MVTLLNMRKQTNPFINEFNGTPYTLNNPRLNNKIICNRIKLHRILKNIVRSKFGFLITYYDSPYSTPNAMF